MHKSRRAVFARAIDKFGEVVYNTNRTPKRKGGCAMGYREATTEEQSRFEEICRAVQSLEGELEFDRKHKRVIRRQSLEGGRNIGGLGEKTMHLSFKYFLEENPDFHEVAVGKHYADIMRDGHITEIQTRSFCSFRKKLAAVSENHRVTVVHPIIQSKRLFWTDPDSGEIVGGRKSPKHGDIYTAFRELVYIRELLQRENLGFIFPVVECDEYKILCGWDSERKKGSVRYSLIPTKLIGFYEYDTAFAFATLLPRCDDEYLTVKKVASLIGKPPRATSPFVNVLMYLDILQKSGKEGNAIKYIYGENY